MIRRSLPIVLALALSACGFHLRSPLVLPGDLGPVRVASVDRYSPLADSLSQSIRRAGATIAPPTDETATVVDLLSERWGDTPISVDELGRAQEFSLRYAVVFEVRRADGTKPVPRQAVELSRDYISNPVNAIGTEGEREILVRELRREMAASIIRRLGAGCPFGRAVCPGFAPGPAGRRGCRQGRPSKPPMRIRHPTNRPPKRTPASPPQPR
jgi:LPS-assembly lipoprotein